MSATDWDLQRGFYLGDCFVEPEASHISRFGSARHVSPGAMAVLVLLAENQNKVISRKAIIGAVWGNEGGGSNEALTRAVSELRHAMDDHATAPRVIQTVHARGYRLLPKPAQYPESPETEVSIQPTRSGFWGKLLRHGVIQAGAAYLIVGWLLIQIAEVTFSDIGLPEWAEQFVTFVVLGGFPLVLLLSWFLEFADGRIQRDVGARRGTILDGLDQNYLAIFIAYALAGLGAGAYQITFGFDAADNSGAPSAAAAPIPVAKDSLAVLRLAEFGEDERLRPLAEGLSEDLIDALAKVPGLSVSSRGDSWSLAPNSRSETIRERLRVSHYVEGSIRFLNANTLRIVVQLVSASTGFHVVSRGFDVALPEYTSLPAKVTQLLVSNLRLGLAEDSAVADFRSQPTISTDSYILYRQGLHELYKPRSTASLESAIGFFNAALRIDADYPAAHAGICRAHTLRYSIHRSALDVENAEAACAQALAAGPRLPYVLNTAANLYLTTGNLELAKDTYQDALQQDKRSAAAMAGLAKIAAATGEFNTAESLIQQAITLQPGNWRLMNNLAGLYFSSGMYEQAIEEYAKIELIAPDNFAAIGNLGAARLMTGNLASAQADLERALALEFDPLIASNLGIVHYFQGDFDAAVDVFQDLSERSPDSTAVQVALADALHFAESERAAKPAYEKAANLAAAEMKINPEDPELLTLWGWSLAMSGDVAAARRAIDKALVLAADDPYTHYYQALVESRAGNTDLARRALANARKYGYPDELVSADPFLP